MRIAHIMTHFPSVSQTFILNQLLGMLDMGHDVSILAYGSEESVLHPNIIKYSLLERTSYLCAPLNKATRALEASKWISSKGLSHPKILLDALNIVKHKRTAVNLCRLFEYIRLLENAPFDIIHCHFGGIAKRIAPMLREIPYKGFVTSFYGHDVTRKSQILPGTYDELIEMGDLFLPLCSSMKGNMLRLGFPDNKMICHPLGVDPGMFPFCVRMHTAGEPVQVLTIARFVEKKGLCYAIRAVARVLQESKINIRYRIVGSGPLERNLKTLVKEIGISTHVKFMGELPQDKIAECYREADLFLLPSVTASDGDQEGTPTVLIEAQATGLPVLSTFHSGIPDIVKNGASGYLVPEHDVNALTERLVHLARHPEEWSKLGSMGRRIVEEHYDVRKLNTSLVTIYERLLDI